jgi:hypothetical protein
MRSRRGMLSTHTIKNQHAHWRERKFLHFAIDAIQNRAGDGCRRRNDGHHERPTLKADIAHGRVAHLNLAKSPVYLTYTVFALTNSLIP